MKIRTEIKRVDLYVIHIDEKEWNAQDHIEVMGNFESLNEVAERLAFSLMRFGTDEPFHEGFGNVAMVKNGEFKQHYINGNKLKAKDYNKGIVAHIMEEDEDFEYDTEIDKTA